MRRSTEASLRCSFCHKSEKTGIKLISSPSDYPRAYICDECVAVCASIIEDDRHEAAEPSAMGVYHPLAPHLIEAVELWIRRESAGEDATGELQEVRSIASEMIPA
jgi:hypothetical protein